MNKQATFTGIWGVLGYLIAVSGCGPGSFVDSSQSHVASSALSSDPGSSSDEDPDEEVQAVVPSVISGSFLTCGYLDSGTDPGATLMSCSTNPGNLESFIPDQLTQIRIGDDTFEITSVVVEDIAIRFVLRVPDELLDSLSKIITLENKEVMKEKSIRPQEILESTPVPEVSQKVETVRTENLPVFTGTGNTFRVIKDMPDNFYLTGASDSGNMVSFLLIEQPSSGTVSGFDGAGGGFTYNPAASFTGIDSFSFALVDGEYQSEVFTAYVAVIENIMIRDNFERAAVANSDWIQSLTWGDGLEIYDRNTANNKSLFLFGDAGTNDLDDIKVASRFQDFSEFASGSLDLQYLVQDVGDDLSGADFFSETMKIRICVKSDEAECGISPRDELKLDDNSIWVEIFTTPEVKLNQQNRNCKDTNWHNLNVALDFDLLKTNYPGFQTNKVSVMIEAQNMQGGMEEIANLDKNCNDVVIIDNFLLKGTGLSGN